MALFMNFLYPLNNHTEKPLNGYNSILHNEIAETWLYFDIVILYD